MSRGPTPKNKVPDWALTIKARRVRLGLTQEEIVEKSKDILSQANISDIERGKVSLENVGIQKAVALARALNWSLYDLQQETGVDLGIGQPESNATIIPDDRILLMYPVYPLSEATSWPHMTELEDQTVSIPKKDYLKSLKVFLDGGSTLHFVDTQKVKPETGHRYLIVHQDQPLICDCKPFGDQGVFIGPAQQLIPVQDARVLGQLLETRINFTPSPTLN